ncbi:hypothetical protein MWN63_13650, partial [Paradonghicola geojensis]|nr:hypothetical protein [Marivivens geojensis]
FFPNFPAIRPFRPPQPRLSAAGEGGSKVITQNPQAVFYRKFKKLTHDPIFCVFSYVWVISFHRT